MRCRPAETIGIKDEFVAYAFNAAVVRWGTAFDAAIADSVTGAKTQSEAEKRQQSAIRRWIPSTRKYR
jgi:hypothetical protein